MRDIFVEETRDFPTSTWLWRPVKPDNLKTDPSPFNVSQSSGYWQHDRSLAGSPFDSSDSDSSSDSDDVISLGSSDLSTDASLVSEDLKTLDIMGSNALGLVFMSKEDILATEAVATLAQQAEGLRAPRHHQDDRSCGRPNQNHHAQQEHVAVQSDGPTDETLVRKFPQDIGLWADVSDSSGPKMFQGLCGSPFEKVYSFGDGCDQPDIYDHNLRAPRMKPISLPEEQEYDEEFLYSGPDLGGWLTGTLDGVPKTVLSGLGCLDIGLPMPFAMEN
ncbi:hypothetical protein F5888DRAFT_1803725 [Russula emetica]|nr:hypothetical protein F5888DRAFT_1803725 [Russula emetica]